MFGILKPLFFSRGNLSLGRISFWLVLIVSLIHYAAFSVYWQVILMALLGYNLGSKFINKNSE